MKKKEIILDPLPSRPQIAEITYCYNSAQKHPDTIVLALLNKMTCTDLEQLRYTRDYYPEPGTCVAFQSENIEIECKECDLDEKGDLKNLVLVLRSWSGTTLDLRRMANKISDSYEVTKSSGLRDTRYYFEQQPFTILPGRVDENGEPTIDYDNQLPYFCFRRYPLIGNTTLDNLYGEEVDLLRTRVDEFLENRAWYVENGLPYTMGFCFSGPPGTGKTSALKGAAKRMRRHIVNVKLTRGISRSQLEKLFKQPIMVCYENPETKDETLINVPLTDRLYVFEEVDINCGFLTRDDPLLRSGVNSVATPVESTNPQETSKEENKQEANETPNPFDAAPYLKKMVAGNAKRVNFPRTPLPANRSGAGNPFPISATISSSQSQKPTLGDLLTIIDGPNEMDGFVLIMTTNHPEKLDPAILRPGRLERVRFKNFRACDIKQMMSKIYKLDLSSEGNQEISNLLSKIPDGKFSAAEISALIRTYPRNPLRVVQTLLTNDTSSY